MLDIMKDILATRFDRWKKEITDSETKTHTIDMSTEIGDIMSRNIITVAFGEDINDEMLEIQVRRTNDGSDFETKKVTLSAAINESFDQIVQTIPGKMVNPLISANLVQLNTPFTAY